MAEGVGGNTRYGTTLEDIEVHVHMVGLGRDDPRALGVPHHDIRIGSNRDAALARIHVEQLGGVGGSHGHKLAQGETALVDPFIPEDGEAILYSSRTIGNLGKVIPPSCLLVLTEAAVIGGGGMQISSLKAVPERILMLLRTEGRAHHMPRGKVDR